MTFPKSPKVTKHEKHLCFVVGFWSLWLLRNHDKSQNVNNMRVAWASCRFTNCSRNQRSHKRLKFLLWWGFRALWWSQSLRSGGTHARVFFLWSRFWCVGNEHKTAQSEKKHVVGKAFRAMRVSQILTSYNEHRVGERFNYYQRLLRGMPSRLAKCRANNFGPCGK